MINLSTALLEATFEVVRSCGKGQKECQALWLSLLDHPDSIVEVIHPKHESHAGGFQLDGNWLTAFWLQIRETHRTVRAQVHTHPQKAGHSETDDLFPIVHTAGFLSVVIPNFGLGKVGFGGVYVAEIGRTGAWRSVRAESAILLT